MPDSVEIKCLIHSEVVPFSGQPEKYEEIFGYPGTLSCQDGKVPIFLVESLICEESGRGYVGILHDMHCRESWVHKTNDKVHTSPSSMRLTLDGILGALLRYDRMVRDNRRQRQLKTKEIMIVARNERAIRSLTNSYNKWSYAPLSTASKETARNRLWVKSTVRTSNTAVDTTIRHCKDADIRTSISRLINGFKKVHFCVVPPFWNDEDVNQYSHFLRQMVTSAQGGRFQGSVFGWSRSDCPCAECKAWFKKALASMRSPNPDDFIGFDKSPNDHSLHHQLVAEFNKEQQSYQMVKQFAKKECENTLRFILCQKVGRSHEDDP